jgi:hypothetical protein
MSAPAKSIFVVGLNAGRIYAISGDYPAATSPSTVYDGLAVGGPVSFEYTPPDPTAIQHPGNNTILQRDVLPSEESSSATLAVSRMDYDTLVLLSNTKVRTVGEANRMGWGTDQAGNEPTVALVLYQQGKLKDGSRGWHTYVIPRCVIIPKPTGMSRERSDVTYNVFPQSSTQDLVGLDFDVTNDGFTSAEVLDYESNYRMHWSFWKADGLTKIFTFASGLPAVNTAGMVVYNSGVATTTGDSMTLTTSNITFNVSVTTNNIVAVQYELASAADDLV